MTNPTSKTWRSPAFGIAQPNQVVEVLVELPLDLDQDVPVIVAWPKQHGLIVAEVHPNSVKIRNPTDKAIPFALLFTRKKWVTVATYDWRLFFENIKRMRRN